MAIQGLPGSKRIALGPYPSSTAATPTTTNATTLDAVNEAAIWIGRVETSDGGSHTIDTTGSSSIGWRANAVTFSSISTTVKIGVAAVDMATGPPARAVNVSNVITFDVNAAPVGGGGGIAAGWVTSVPTSGMKTIAHGDLVAICVQMTARGGTDALDVISHSVSLTPHRPSLTQYVAAAYTAAAAIPNVFITFADGATGWISGGVVSASGTTRAYNSTNSPNEYGQLYQMPFAMKIYGVYGWVAPGGDFSVVLYSDPLSTPVAERTVAVDANTMSSSTARYFEEWFSSPYTAAANQQVAFTLKPGTSNITAYYKMLSSSGHRVADPWGTSGYGVSRTSGAFANANSSLEHYYMGLLLGAFDDGAATTRDNFFMVM